MQSVMEILKIRDRGLGPKEMSRVLAILEAGEVVMHPTETCYGLTCDIFNEEALQRLYALKRMSFDKPVSIMVRSVKDGGRYAYFSDLALRLAQRFWPGPLTLVLPRRDSLPLFLNKGHDTVGLRCPDHALTQALLKAMGTPLATTSANLSGGADVYRVSDLDLEPTLVLDDGEISRRPPSTVVRIKEEKMEILRRGELADEVLQFVD